MTEHRSEGIAWSVAGNIGRIVLDRPQAHNAIDSACALALTRAITEVAQARPRVVLLTGRGSVFCAGADIAAMTQQGDRLSAYIDEILTHLHPSLLRLASLPAPVVTAINGSAGGAGVGLALCGDFALGAASMKLRTGYAAIGLSPDMGATYFMARRAGAVRAKQLFMTSDPIDAQRCLDWGIVDAIVPDTELAAHAEALCQRLADAAPQSLANIKRLCDGAALRELEAHLALEKSLLIACAASADGREGVRAFIERRAPRFSRS